MQPTITKAENCYTSCACNRTPFAADWGDNGLICYGACYSVAIYDYKEDGGRRILNTLTGHKGRVNAVKWVRNRVFDAETELVSVSTDQCGLVWKKSGDSYIVSDVLRGHEGSVTVVDAVYTQDTGANATLLVVTASVDSTIRLWQRNHEEAAVCKHVVPLSAGICLSARIAQPSECNALLLACGLDDSNIHLYAVTEEGVTKQHTLRGHDDWVIALDFTSLDGGDLLLASGSQDSSVRLWRFQPPQTHSEDQTQTFHTEQQLLTLGTVTLAVSLESVLLGHDGRVYSVHWHPPIHSEPLKPPVTQQPLKLLTSSLDKTVVVWAPEDQSGVWLEEARMGEVGGNTLGFYGARFGPQGAAILAHSYQGGFHMWHKTEDQWKPGVVVGGHFDAVSDLGWERTHGRYVVSVSCDQTTRLHAPWLPPDRDKNSCPSWHELARPQIHGYDLVCLAMLPGFQFVSGADEKVARAFTAPQNFFENFKRLCLDNMQSKEPIEDTPSLPTGAAVPVLGLSNKAVFQTEVNGSGEPAEERHVKDQYDDNSYFTPQHLQEPPTEDNLLQNTLWPETMKLYGHGYEIFSLAATVDGSLLASACKATNEEHAAILLWDTRTWQKVGRLVSHQLTITQLEFSPDDQFLLSVSRDRRWSVFQKSDSDVEKYKLSARTDKSTGIHSRIIWCCAWSHDSAHFATGSRDGKVVVWGRSGENHPVLGQFSASSECLDLPKESITSLSFGAESVLSKGEYLMAVGSEVGDIRLYGWSTAQWRFLYQLSGNLSHHLTVKRLAFRPKLGKTGQSLGNDVSAEHIIVQLASCGLDHTLKIHDLYIMSNTT